LMRVDLPLKIQMPVKRAVAGRRLLYN